MPLRKGQKLTDNPKSILMGVRLTQNKADDLQYCVEKLGMKKSDVIALGIELVKEQIEKQKG